MSDAIDEAVLSENRIPLSEVLVDVGDFRRLPRRDREEFLNFIEHMQRDELFGRNGRPSGVPWAAVDLSQYVDYPQFVATLKRSGKSFYEGRRADSHGYYSEFFDERTFVGDLVAINTSSPERQGKPMTPDHMRTVDEMGGYPEQFFHPATPAHAIFWQRHFGVFHACPGHRQGSVVVDKELVGYIIVHRYGNFAHYWGILGHREHLKYGVMHKMHLDFVKAVLDVRNAGEPGCCGDSGLRGLTYICYNGYYGDPNGPAHGITLWKKAIFSGRAIFSSMSGRSLEVRKQTRRSAAIQQSAIGRSGNRKSGSEWFAWESTTPTPRWAFLRRYWGRKEALPDLGTDRFGRERLPRWHLLAVRAGRSALFEYFRLKENSLSAMTTAGAAPVHNEAAVGHETADLWRQYYNGGLRGMIGQFIDTISEEGFPPASSDWFSPELVLRLSDVFRAAAIECLHWTEEFGEVPTIETLRANSSTAFPVDAVRGKKNVLCVSLTREYGREDVIHLYDAHPQDLTLIDSDVDSMREIALIYPDNWKYVTADDKQFVQNAMEREEIYDLIVFNVFPGRAREVGLTDLPLIMRICSDTVITNYTDEMLDELDVATYEPERLSEVVSNKTGVRVEVSHLSRERGNLNWAVIRKR